MLEFANVVAFAFHEASGQIFGRLYEIPEKVNINVCNIYKT